MSNTDTPPITAPAPADDPFHNPAFGPLDPAVPAADRYTIDPRTGKYFDELGYKSYWILVKQGNWTYGPMQNTKGPQPDGPGPQPPTTTAPPNPVITPGAGPQSPEPPEGPGPIPPNVVPMPGQPSAPNDETSVADFVARLEATSEALANEVANLKRVLLS